MMEGLREKAQNTKDPKVQIQFGKFLLESSINLRKRTDHFQDADKLESEAIHWIRRLHKLNYPEAIYIVGTWYEKGIHQVAANESKAFGLFMSASKLGVPAAIDKIAFHYERKKDYQRAVVYYKKAAALNDPSANYRLGIACIYGELKLASNFKNAEFYLKRAAIESNTYCPQGAYVWALILFGLFEQDLGIRDDEEGQEYLNKAAKLGYLPALYKQGYCFEFGKFGYPVDPEQSIFNYLKAAEEGHAEAQVGLSSWYATGAPGILEQDDSLAFEWCVKASKQSLPSAEFLLGQFHEMGVGVEPDFPVALEWYNRAANNGSLKAKQRLANIGSSSSTLSGTGSMTGSQLSRQKRKGDCIIS